VHVETIAAPGLAERVEQGGVGDAETLRLVDTYLDRVRRSGADVLALGCTHYAFLRDVIERRAGEGIAVIEPSEAVARQVVRVLESQHLRNPRSDGGDVLYLTSGDERAFAEQRRRLREAGAPIPEPVST
jgi:glutamate racemase